MTSDCLVQAVVVPDEGVGFVTIRFTLVDMDSDPIDLTVEISMNGKRWYPATVSGDTPLTGLPSSADGVEGGILWDSLDLGFRGAGGFIRLTPRTRRGEVRESPSRSPATTTSAKRRGGSIST